MLTETQGGADYWGYTSCAVLGAKPLVQSAIFRGDTPHPAPLAPVHYHLPLLIREPH
jgi:hypothetical protein